MMPVVSVGAYPVPRWRELAVPLRLQVGNRLLRGVMTGRAHHTAARPGTGTAEVKTPDRSLVGRAAGNGPEIERLLGDELALEDVPAGETEASFDVGRRQHLPDDHR